jgi:hypothetical protein
MELQQYKKAVLMPAALLAVMAASQTLHAAETLRLSKHPLVRTQEAKPPDGKPRAQAGSGNGMGELAKKLTSEEHAALSRSDSPPGRIKTYIRLLRERLKGARNLLDRDEYAATGEYLEVYAGLVNEAGRFLKESVRPRDGANKTLEQGLREQIRVLEGIRRDVSVTHLGPVEKALEAANRVRIQALNALLGSGKILLPEPGAKKPPSDQP